MLLFQCSCVGSFVVVQTLSMTVSSVDLFVLSGLQHMSCCVCGYYYRFIMVFVFYNGFCCWLCVSGNCFNMYDGYSHMLLLGYRLCFCFGVKYTVSSATSCSVHLVLRSV